METRSALKVKEMKCQTHKYLIAFVCLSCWFTNCSPTNKSLEFQSEGQTRHDGGTYLDTGPEGDKPPIVDTPRPDKMGSVEHQNHQDLKETPDTQKGQDHPVQETHLPPEEGQPPEKRQPPEQTKPLTNHQRKCSGVPNPGGRGAILPKISGKEYTIDLKRWNIKNNGTDPNGTTTNLQKAIDWAASQKYAKVRLPAGTYLIGQKKSKIYSGGIKLHSNMAFIMDKKAILQMFPNDTWNYSMIAVVGKKNVSISGGTIRGDRKNHNYPNPKVPKGHDEGHGIEIKASQYVLVENVTITETTGDGVLIVGSGKTSAKDVTIRKSELFYNRRQGVSIVGGIDILIENCKIHHIKGTSPQFGVDIESLSFTSKDIIIRNNQFYNNFGGDIVNTDGRNVLMEKNTHYEGDGVRNLDGPIVFWPRADQTIRGNTLKVRKGSVNGKVGILGYSSKKPRKSTGKTCIYDNKCDGCGFYIYHTTHFEVRNNEFINGYIAMQYIKNILLFNNKVTHASKRWAYRFKVITGRAGGNLYNGKPFQIPLSDKPWTGAWIE